MTTVVVWAAVEKTKPIDTTGETTKKRGDKRR
jgi:hypothetical protein